MEALSRRAKAWKTRPSWCRSGRTLRATAISCRSCTNSRSRQRLPFYLFFTYNDPSTFKLGESSDGSVALSSQLTFTMQTSAVKVLGFNENHDSFMNSKDGRQAFLRLLEVVSPVRVTGKN